MSISCFLSCLLRLDYIFFQQIMKKGVEKRQHAFANLVLDLCNVFRDLSGGKQ